MKILNGILWASVLCAGQLFAADCLKPIGYWQVCNFKDAAEPFYGVGDKWGVSAVTVPARDDGDDTYEIRVTSTTGIWIGYSQSGNPFFVGRFGKGKGKLAVMHVLEIRNGLGIVEWKIDVLTSTRNGITVSASAELEDGGYDSVFCGYGHEFGFLETGWAKRPTGVTEGDWYSGGIIWLRDGKFVPDENEEVKYRRLYSKYTDASNFAVGVYMYGADQTLAQMDIIGEFYVSANNSTGSAARKEQWWEYGWNWAFKYFFMR